MADLSSSFTLQELIESLSIELYEAHQNSFLLQLQNWNDLLGNNGLDEAHISSSALQGLADKRLLAVDEVTLRVKVSPLPPKISFGERLKLASQLLLNKNVKLLSPKVFYFQEAGESPFELEIKLVRDREGRFVLSDGSLSSLLKKLKVSTNHNSD